MAKSKKTKQRAHEARAARHESKASRKSHDHLPKVGTPADNAYRLRRSREDLVAFGEFRNSRGPTPVIIAVLVGLLFVLGILAWVLFFI
jgi:hypothetical protein